MMMRSWMLAVVIALAVAVPACSATTSSVAGQNSVNGEIWYVKETGFFGLVFSADIYYCPAPGGQGPATCQQAKVYTADDKVEPAMSEPAVGEVPDVSSTAKKDDDDDDDDDSDDDDAGESDDEDGDEASEDEPKKKKRRRRRRKKKRKKKKDEDSEEESDDSDE